MLNFSEILKDLRLERKLSQPQLADIIGVSKGMISFWENRICEPTASNIIKLAKFFGVTTDYLLGVEE